MNFNLIHVENQFEMEMEYKVRNIKIKKNKILAKFELIRKNIIIFNMQSSLMQIN